MFTEARAATGLFITVKMQLFTLAVLSFLSVVTISAHPFSLERGDSYARRARSIRDLGTRDASPFTVDGIKQGTHHAMDHVRHSTHNRTVAVKEQAHKYAPTAAKYESGTEMAICAVGAFIPVVDIAIDSACLGLVAAKGGHALYKHAHNTTHTAKNSESSHNAESSQHFDPSQHKEPPQRTNSAQHSDPSQHPGPPQHTDPVQHSDSSQHPEPSQHKRDLYIRSMHAYWNSL